jgi:hypothetical protein
MQPYHMYKLFIYKQYKPKSSLLILLSFLFVNACTTLSETELEKGAKQGAKQESEINSKSVSNPTSSAKSKTSIVLVPDSDGEVGELTITKENGSQAITQAFTSINVKQSDELLASPIKVSKSETNKTFAEAIAAQPNEAIVFLLYFDPVTNQLIKESETKLQETIQIIKQSEAIDIYISGQTKDQGADQISDKLAIKLSKTVSDIIASQLKVTQHAEIVINSYKEAETSKNIKATHKSKTWQVEVTIHI